MHNRPIARDVTKSCDGHHIGGQVAIVEALAQRRKQQIPRNLPADVTDDSIHTVTSPQMRSAANTVNCHPTDYKDIRTRTAVTWHAMGLLVFLGTWIPLSIIIVGNIILWS